MTVKQLTMCGLTAALIAVLAPISIPLATEVPVSLATLAVMLAGGLCGSKYGPLAVLIYILLGCIGIPVFAGYTSGAGILFGMTGGYILGYIPLAWAVGFAYEHFHAYGERVSLIFGELLGSLILYILGTGWFMFVTGMSLSGALAACVLPFLPGDVLKCIAACILIPRLVHAAGMVYRRAG